MPKSSGCRKWQKMARRRQSMSNLWQMNVIQRDGVVRVEQRAVWCSCKSGGDAMQVVVSIGRRWLAATMTAILLQCRKLIREPGMCSSGSWMGSFPLTRSLAAAYLCTIRGKEAWGTGRPPPPSVRCVCPLSSLLALSNQQHRSRVGSF
jgi:hypothetical protein